MVYDPKYDEHFVLDREGNRLYAGDYVKCVTNQYESIRKDERRRIQRIEDGNIVLNNQMSPHGTSPYRPTNFTLYMAIHNHQFQAERLSRMCNKQTLYVAVRINGKTCNEIADGINADPRYHLDSRADTSGEALKEWLRQRIRVNPEERWLILTGTTLAEISAPPVSFRSV